MKSITLLAVGFLSGCTINTATPTPHGTFSAPVDPIEFPGISVVAKFPVLKDERPADQRVTQSIREYATTTMLIGDDLLKPSGLRILEAKLAERLPSVKVAQNISINIFLVSVWGRSPQLKASEVNLISRELYFIPVPIATVISEVKSPTAPPSGYSADLLRVSIHGTVDGVSFSAADSRRLSGTVSHDEIRDLVNTVSNEAVNEMARLITKQAGIHMPLGSNQSFQGTLRDKAAQRP